MVPVATLFNILSLISVCVTAAMHWYGIDMSLYWTVSWWDVLTHFFGGLTVGLWAAAVGIRTGLSKRQTTELMIALILCVGVSWELWEALEHLSGDKFDTLKDVIDDMLGTGAAWLIYKLLYKRGQMW